MKEFYGRKGFEWKNIKKVIIIPIASLVIYYVMIAGKEDFDFVSRVIMGVFASILLLLFFAYLLKLLKPDLVLRFSHGAIEYYPNEKKLHKARAVADLKSYQFLHRGSTVTIHRRTKEDATILLNFENPQERWSILAPAIADLEGLQAYLESQDVIRLEDWRAADPIPFQ